MDIQYTHHANTRKQQRSITDLEVELILMYGRESYHGQGSTFTMLDRKGFKRLERDLKRVTKRLERLKQEFVVDADGESVITVGHKYRHIHQR